MHSSVPVHVTYQIKASLVGAADPIWRRLQVPGDISLAKLHAILQIAFGWKNSHLYQFVIDGIDFGTPNRRADFEPSEDERTYLLQDLLYIGLSFTYEYDFGDGWEVNVAVDAVLQSPSPVRQPFCTAAGRAAPPEDCGGLAGYEALVNAYDHPEAEDYAEAVELLGPTFNPRVCDVDRINRGFAAVNVARHVDG